MRPTFVSKVLQDDGYVLTTIRARREFPLEVGTILNIEITNDQKTPVNIYDEIKEYVEEKPGKPAKV